MPSSHAGDRNYLQIVHNLPLFLLGFAHADFRWLARRARRTLRARLAPPDVPVRVVPHRLCTVALPLPRLGLRVHLHVTERRVRVLRAERRDRLPARIFAWPYAYGRAPGAPDS